MDTMKYKIVSTSLKGRSLFAKTELAAGEVILDESPLVSSQFSWNKGYGYLACEHCMYPLESAEQNIRRLTFDATVILPYAEADPTKEALQSAVQCPECLENFCSAECLAKAEKEYHKVMCRSLQPDQPFFKINELWKRMHYPPETASVLLVLRTFAMIKTQPDLLSKFGEFCDQFINEDLSICHKMLGEKFTSQISQLHQAFAETFADDEAVHKYLTFDGLTKMFAMIGTNSQGIGTSSFAGWVKNIGEMKLAEKEQTEIDALIDALYATLDETAGQFLNNEGSGLYLTQSKINHSCNPNAEIQFPFSNSTVQVVALREIKPEEEICISYLDECQLNRSRHSRQRYLQENYLFLCECDKCQEEIHQPDVTSDEEEEDMETDDED